MNPQTSSDYFLVGQESILRLLVLDQHQLRAERVVVEGQGYLVVRGSKVEIEPIVASIATNSAFSICCLMDRVYFLKDLNDLESVGIAFFEAIALEYETLISGARNVKCAHKLLRLATEAQNMQMPQRVLDFGCGTGLSTKALEELVSYVVGYDGSAAMRGLTKGAGSVVVDSLSQCPPGSIDMVVACYVMHFGIHESDANELFRITPPGGIIAANFHKGIALEAVTSRLERVGFSLGETFHGSSSEFGPIALFHRGR